MNHGLQLVGVVKAVGPVTRRDGSAVRGMFRIEVDIAAADSDREFVRDAVFFDTDQDTGEESRIAARLRERPLVPGEVVAVKVIAKASESGGKYYVNYTATGVEVVTPAPAAVKAGR